MAKRQTTAAELIVQLNGMGEQIEKAVIAEVRHYLGGRLGDMAAGTARADAEINACRGPERVVTDLEITDDFRAGLAFAAELVADPGFDY